MMPVVHKMKMMKVDTKAKVILTRIQTCKFEVKCDKSSNNNMKYIVTYRKGRGLLDR